MIFRAAECTEEGIHLPPFSRVCENPVGKKGIKFRRE
jgi:hypothetical protein